MAADTFTADEEPYSILRSTVSSSANTYRAVTIPAWATTVTIESEAGLADLFVARVGADEGALGSHYVTVVTGAGPREFNVSWGGQRLATIYVASATTSAAFVAEAEAAAR